uniref:AA_permease domain-containing protein n=1 Tax=Ascaris lumbricoides TaxID=6252 RepID=A0A0M3INC8_ASCLU
MAVVTVLTMSSTVVVGFFHADPRHWVASGFFKDGTTGVSNVTATISVVMAVVTVLTMSSTVVVGFFHADPRHWVASGFFKDGTTGVSNVICGASCFICAYAGVEALSYLFEETHAPRIRIPLILPFIVFTFTLFIFLVTMVFTMTTDFSKFPTTMLLPDVFAAIKIPSARYIMTVGAVCGLSGAMLVVFLPASRLLSSLAFDRLLPCQCISHRSKKRGIPYLAVLVVAIFSCALIPLKRDVFFDVMAFNIPIRMLLLACLVYVQHYRSDPIGLLRETAKYHEIGRKRFRTYSLASYLDDKGSVITAKCASDEEDDEDSMTSSEFLHIYFSQQESAKLQHRLEKKISTRMQQHALMEASSPDENSLQSLTSFEACNHGHNCIRSPCSPIDENNSYERHRFHLFEREVPELPYCEQFSREQCDSPTNDRSAYRRAINILIAFILASFAVSLLALKAENFFMLHALLPASALVIALIILMLLAGRQITNDNISRRKCKTPIFPYLTLLVVFLTALLTCSANFITFVKVFTWTVVGKLVTTIIFCLSYTDWS